jgi:hypothetical protein
MILLSIAWKLSTNNSRTSPGRDLRPRRVSANFLGRESTLEP